MSLKDAASRLLRALYPAVAVVGEPESTNLTNKKRRSESDDDPRQWSAVIHSARPDHPADCDFELQLWSDISPAPSAELSSFIPPTANTTTTTQAIRQRQFRPSSEAIAPPLPSPPPPLFDIPSRPSVSRADSFDSIASTSTAFSDRTTTSSTGTCHSLSPYPNRLRHRSFHHCGAVTPRDDEPRSRREQYPHAHAHPHRPVVRATTEAESECLNCWRGRPVRAPSSYAQHQAPPRLRLRNLVWTGAFAAVTIVGAIYGAGLKTQQEYNAEKKKVAELPVEDRIRGLEEHRARLVAQKIPLEKKLAGLRARMGGSESGGGGEEEGAGKGGLR
ncbi:hypothetical protein F4778DRAFT_802870 [Xylariomycetidae sp. FL2044]|nr:hypothetical protein F4778DRAFT_802870 [Xylariomycetidae sp. FL2044]